jgi:NADH:ubiquinone oxidoreductase subunit H
MVLPTLIEASCPAISISTPGLALLFPLFFHHHCLILLLLKDISLKSYTSVNCPTETNTMLFKASTALLAFSTLVSSAAIPLEKRATVTDGEYVSS